MSGMCLLGVGLSCRSGSLGIDDSLCSVDGRMERRSFRDAYEAAIEAGLVRE